MEEIKIKAIVEEYNEKYCAVPLEAKEINRIWKSVKKFVASINGARAYERQKYQERKTREAYEQEFYKGERRKIEQKKPLLISILVRLNEEGELHYSYGQLTYMPRRSLQEGHFCPP